MCGVWVEPKSCLSIKDHSDSCANEGGGSGVVVSRIGGDSVSETKSQCDDGEGGCRKRATREATTSTTNSTSVRQQQDLINEAGWGLWWSNKGAKQCHNGVAKTSSSTSSSPFHTTRFHRQYSSNVLYIVLCLIFFIISNNLVLVSCGDLNVDGGGVSGLEASSAPVYDNTIGKRGHFTPTWAVHIPGGEEVADQVATQHGFINQGKIFGEYYHFHHNTIQKRSLNPAYHHQDRLDSDERVHSAIQQVAKSRQKRDFIRLKSGPSRTFSFPLNDPKWLQMWYLNRGNGLDMNVIPAWKEGVTGKGIVVTILDDGLERDHPDLEHNYDPRASYDVNSHDEDPQPHYDIVDSNRHGTRCAGEVAATANNSLCAVGIAFGARVGGVRMLDGDVTDAVEARSLSLNPQHIDIYSASWGPDDDGKTVDGPGEMATKAFIEGVTKGRSGKGSIFIWASGNGGREHDNCNCDGYTNSIWTLSISSATEEGSVPWYSEMCSSTLATTYSSGGQGEKQIVTTDLHHTCTASHTGTSASAPLAAGIVALVLEANPDLTWRDLQHIVVRTAKPGNLDDPTWGRNGVGRRVSHSFGYGLMDAAAMVKLARNWKTVPEQQKCEINAPHLDRTIPPKTDITLQLAVEHCRGVNYLEHVQAKITLTSQRRGDIQIYLTSPAGTRVTLLTSRIHDISRAGFTSWPFMSVHTWGEAPQGNWLLQIRNEGRYMGHASLKNWVLILYGTKTPVDKNDPISVQIPVSSLNAVQPVNYPSVMVSGSKMNGKGNRKQQQGQASSTSVTANSKKNNGGSGGNGGGGNKNGKNNAKSTTKGLKATTARPSFTTLLFSSTIRRTDYLNANHRTTTAIPRERTKSKQQQSPNNVENGNSMDKVSTGLGAMSVIPEKIPIKAPKQIKDSNQQLRLVDFTMTPGPTSASTALQSRLSDLLFQKYDKIQQIYPEFHPYVAPLNEGDKKTSQFLAVPNPNANKKLILGAGGNTSSGKPSRENSKIIFFSDPDFYPATSKPKKSNTIQRTNVHTNLNQQKAQISDWRLIFYGTEKPAQPGDVPRYGGKPTFNGIDIDDNSLDFEGERSSGQWRDTHQVGESHVDIQRTAPSDITSRACLDYSSNKMCIECDQTSFLFKGLCYSGSCPDGSYLMSKEEAATERKLLHQKHIEDAAAALAVNGTEAGEVQTQGKTPRSDAERQYDDLDDILRQQVPKSMSSTEIPLEERAIMPPKIQNLCGVCSTSCLKCSGALETECTACDPGLVFYNLEKSELKTETGVCAIGVASAQSSLIKYFNESILILAIGLIITLAIITTVVILIRRCFKEKAVYRDDYAYDKISTGLLNDDGFQDDVKSAKFTYRNLEKQFSDEPVKDYHDDDDTEQTSNRK